jgi:hypothetical protein
MISELTILAAIKALFKSRPTLEDYIAAHNPTDIYHVERLQQQYDRMVKDHPYWG